MTGNGNISLEVAGSSGQAGSACQYMAFILVAALVALLVYAYGFRHPP